MKLTPIVAVALVLVVAGLAVLPAAPAAAHADYDSSAPTRGEQLAVAPALVEITFTQEIQKVAGTYDITVNKDRGLSVTGGPVVVNDADRTKMSVLLLPDLEDGRYVVNWSNVSDADGDPKVGAFSFYLNHVPTAVDLANDAALEQLGNETETPVGAQTSAAETPGTETPTASSGANTPSAEATPEGTPVSDDADGDSSSNTAIIVIVVIVIAAAAAGGALLYVRSRSAG